jgi:hypothetical protein
MVKTRSNTLQTLLAVCGCSLFISISSTFAHAHPIVEAEIVNNQVVVKADEKVFTCYKFASTLKKPYFFPVNGPISQKSLTAESIEPYPHHNSLFFGCDRVNGANFWQEGIGRGQIVSQGPKLVFSKGKKVAFTDTCLWQQPGKDPVIRDTRRITISAPDENLRFIDFEVTLQPLMDIRIERTNHSLFSARMIPHLSVDSGGTLINAEGKTAEKGTWGVASPWCDYFGTRDNITEGIAILQHPQNRWYPSKWFTRDYGFFSPTPMYWPENGTHIELPKESKLTLKYRVVVHAHDTQTVDIAEIFEKYKIADEDKENRSPLDSIFGIFKIFCPESSD